MPCRLLLVAVVAWFASLAGAAEPFRFPEANCEQGCLRYVNGVPVLIVQGTPEEIGEAVGTLALAPARRMAVYPEDLLGHYGCLLLRPTFVRQGNRMWEHVPDDYQRELDAIGRASHIDRDSLVLGNTLFDLKKMLACSALLVEPRRSVTGEPLLARNLDYPALGYAQDYSLVTVYRPKGKHSFAAVGFPGLVGCLSGMNDAGLSLAVLEVFQIKSGSKKLDRAGDPYALCYRRILEECTSIEQARQALEQMHRTTTTNLVLADRDGVAVFEVSPQRIVVRHGASGTTVCTNHYCTEPLRPRVPINPAHSFERFRTLEAVGRGSPVLDLPALQASLSAVSNRKETMQSMIFEPCRLRLHLAIGACPSADQEMKTLDLAPLLAGWGK